VSDGDDHAAYDTPDNTANHPTNYTTHHATHYTAANNYDTGTCTTASADARL